MNISTKSGIKNRNNVKLNIQHFCSKLIIGTFNNLKNLRILIYNSIINKIKRKKKELINNIKLNKPNYLY